MENSNNIQNTVFERYKFVEDSDLTVSKLKNLYFSGDTNLQKSIENYLDAIVNYYDNVQGTTDDEIIPDMVFDEIEQNLNNIFLEKYNFKLSEKILFGNGCFYFHGKPLTEQQTETEKVELISLAKIKGTTKTFEFRDLREVEIWFRKHSNQLKIDNTCSLCVSGKFDGCSLKVVWNDDFTEIKQIVSRGGLDVTNLLKSNQQIRNSSKFKEHIVCGELIIENKVFTDKYSDEYKNPRNFVSSLLKRKELNQEIVDDLSFQVFSNGINPIGPNWKLLDVHTDIKLDQTINDFWIDLKKKNQFNYDGLVFTINKAYKTRPVKDNYPLNMVAFKFPSKTVQTRITGIEWSQKKSGNLIPTVLFESVHLDGSVISRAAGFNYEFVKTNSIGVGSIVEICKSGDIIPYIVKVLTKSEILPLPTQNYIVRGKHLVSQDDEDTNLFKFQSAFKLLQIQGIGETIAEQLASIFDNDIFQVFNKDKKHLIIEKIGVGANWTNFQKVYEINSISLNTLIELCQFNSVGPKMALKCALVIIKDPNASTNNIPESVLSSVCSSTGVKIIQEKISILKSFGITVTRPISIDDSSITYEMSGNPNGMTKAKFSQELKKIYPNSIHTTLSKNTKFLITDNINGNSSKIAKARKYNIEIVTYENALKGKLPIK